MAATTRRPRSRPILHMTPLDSRRDGGRRSASDVTINNSLNRYCGTIHSELHVLSLGQSRYVHGERRVAGGRYHRGSSFLSRSSGVSGASEGPSGASWPSDGCPPIGGIGREWCSSGLDFSCWWCAYAFNIFARSSSARIAASTNGPKRMCCRASYRNA
uniref:Uncharacterized protein n=1 Tax=Pararge aegeria TaxID=116150 RepID=S4PWF3_9NEOP